MTEYLPPPELHALTGFARVTAQTGWLASQGIPHKVDGKRVIVSRVHVQSWLEGRTVVRSTGLNLAGIK
jgi:hypothetical protein